MKASSQERLERARSNLKSFLQAASSKTEEALGEAIGVSDSVIQRLKSAHAENFASVLAELDLKLVPSHVKCFEPAYVESLKTLARQQLLDGTTPPQLEWE